MNTFTPIRRSMLFVHARALVTPNMVRVLATTAQIGALIVTNLAGYWLAEASGVALPGGLVGMLLLLLLLLTGVVRLRWIESGATLLIRHLAFFFIPIAVGLLDYADLLMSDGLALLAALLISAVAGIWSCGRCAQMLGRLRSGRSS